MAVNSAFHTNNLSSISTERALYADLVKEAIQIHGHDVFYVNRTTVALDSVLGEDALSKFTNAQPIEMYIEDAEGFGGDKEIITQFGLENRNEITFVVSKERFQELDSQITLESGTGTTGGSIVLETATTDTTVAGSSVLTVVNNNNFYIIQDTALTDADRPVEGDLVFHPVLEKMFEINFVDHDEPFYQLDNNPVYKLRCKQFEYSSEDMATGIEAIDAIEDALSVDSRAFQFTLEQEGTFNEDIRLEFSLDGLVLEETDGDNIVAEDDTHGGAIQLENAADSGDAEFLISEDYIIGDYNIDKTAQNELFDELDDTVLDFSESNPFGDIGSST